MRVHYLQHVSFEDPGYIKLWLKDKDCVVTATRLFESNFQFPAVDQIDVLIVMGGPMGVYEENKHAWLVEEKTFIRECITAGVKMLGICLGAQLMAVCLGGEVFPAPNKEIGWYPVEPTEECQSYQPWLYGLLKDRPTLFHWHGDKFSIPSGAVNLASSPANTNQAFSYKDKVLALQFHLECTAENISTMVFHGGHELITSSFVQNKEEITSQSGHCESMNQIMKIVLDNFLK